MIGIDHDNGSDDDLELNNLLLDAARWGELNEVKRLIEEEGLDPNLVDENGWSPVMCASHYGHVQIVKFLQDQQADMETVNGDGCCALLLAVIGGHIDVVKLLKECDIDTRSKTPEGHDVLSLAALHGHMSIVKFLVEMGMITAIQHSPQGIVEDVPTVNNSNFEQEYGKALIHASEQGHLPIVQFLYYKGADLEVVKDKSGNNALHCASIGNHREIVIFLVEECLMSISSVNANGQRAVDMTSSEELKCYLTSRENSLHTRQSTKRKLRDQRDHPIDGKSQKKFDASEC